MKIRERRILFFVLLVVNSVPAQQYTGVKSVYNSETEDNEDLERSPLSGGAAGISGRSIDSHVPDSKIIQLSIRPIDPRATSGSRGARNLGFVADASLNAIPGGLNNELDVKVPLIPTTTTVARDSYGNPVTPYAELGTTGLDASGFDPNRDLLQGSRGNQIANLNFKVPSYASGIIEPVRLPSNLPANFDNRQPFQQTTPSTTTIRTTTQFQFVANAKIPTVEDANNFFGQIPGGSDAAASTFQFVPNAKIPTIDEGSILFAQKPINGLVPPLFPDEQGPSYNIEVGTERSTIFAKDPFGGSLLNREFSLPHDKPPLDFNQGVPQLPQGPQIQQLPPRPQIHQPQQPQVPQQQVPQIQQLPQIPQITHHPQPPQPRPTEAPVQKYTGGFGGAPGFLGNQQNIGTAYTSTVAPPKPAQIPQSPLPPPPPPTVFVSSTRPAAPSPSTPNKFTGSFGGAPGLLGNQQNLGTAYKPTTPIPQPPQQPISFQPPPQTSQIPSIIRPPAPFQPPPQYHQPQPQQPQPQPPPQYHQPQPQQPQPQPPQQQPPRPVQQPQPVGNKFTGSFGGAPGLLGNQKKPGTHVKPDGSILPPSGPGLDGQFHGHQQQPVHQHQQQPPVISRPIQNNGGSTFTGSFGGPPGILRPFDNVNKG